MSDSESFIDEVSEEVRRDRLYQLFRKWGWLAALIIVLAVGGAAYFEWSRAQQARAAESFSDAVLDALDNETPSDRAAALAEISPEGAGAQMLLALFDAAQLSEAGEPAAAAARLREAAEIGDLPPRYRDLALLKAHMVFPEDTDAARGSLEELAQPGSPFRGLAVEQLAYLDIASGDREAGLERLRSLAEEAGLSSTLRLRVSEAINAFESGAVLSDDPLPEPEAAPDPAGGLLDLPPANFGGADDAGEDAGDGAEDSDDAPAPAAETDVDPEADADQDVAED